MEAIAEMIEDPCNLLTFEQNIIATAGQILLWTPLIYYLEKNKSKRFVTEKKQYKLKIVDHILGALLIAFMITNTITRITRGVSHWLVQPCHIITLMLIYTIYTPFNNPDHFTFVLYSNWMPVLGLVFYDATWYQYSFELPMFHFQHILMVVIPWYYVWTGRFQLDFNPNRRAIYLQAVGVAMLYHATVLIWFSHYYREDFSGMRCRFPGGEFAGRYWREVQVFLGGILALIFGVIPEFLIIKLFILSSSKTKSA